VNLYLDLDEDLIDHYDEDTNPGGVRRVLENATRYLDNAVAIWKLLGIEDKAAELSVLLRGLWNVYRRRSRHLTLAARAPCLLPRRAARAGCPSRVQAYA
jgi:hypothetical protein